MATKGNGIFLMYTDIDPKLVPPHLPAISAGGTPRAGVFGPGAYALLLQDRSILRLVAGKGSVVHEYTDGKLR